MKKKIVFDLGGVIFKLDFENAISKLLNSKEKNFEELFKKWLLSKSVKLFEANKITFEDFYQRMCIEFNLTLDFDKFTAIFKSLVIGPFEGVDEVFEELYNNYDIYFLSNITAVHWEIMAECDFVKKYLKKPFLSYQIGYVKPEKEIFQYVIKDLNVKAHEILYFDDSKINVDHALENGLKAFHTIGFDEVKNKLLELNCI
ncbi:MAG: HAD-IA family hydrolase [Candidatus Sericytochromatia bacterium]